MKMKAEMGFIEAIEQEAMRIMTEYAPGTRAWGIGLRLHQIVAVAKGEIPDHPVHVNCRILTPELTQETTKQMIEKIKGKIQEIRDTTAAQTTNLNFWQAYQAMKRGEWVRSPKWSDITLYGYMKSDKLYLHEKGGVDEEWTIFTPYVFDFAEWYIVPKGPRYKVGDRFEEIRGDVVDGIITRRVLTREIVHVDDATQTCCVKVEQNGEHAGIHCCSYAYLDTLATKLPS